MKVAQSKFQSNRAKHVNSENWSIGKHAPTQYYSFVHKKQTMSDTQQEESDLLAGRPPAVKAGGMRIVQHKHEKGDGSQSREEKKEQEEEFGTVDVKGDKHHQSLLLSGAVTKGDKDFPPEAVKSYHEKPLPTLDNRPPTKQHAIQQPR